MMQAREIPAEFAAVATLPIPELAARFGVSKSTARTWRKRLGVSVPVGAPKGNVNGRKRTGRPAGPHGYDDPEQIRTCLSCTSKRCTGECIKVH